MKLLCFIIKQMGYEHIDIVAFDWGLFQVCSSFGSGKLQACIHK